ncbi:MAG: hypothetical protein E6K53_07470 [Gammaproteobacteria bacterium]|nr:MAG: hypothetical protein E6K53_07470 [Gammaproteobacteria bacterium]
MNIDLSALDATQLDALIAAAAKRRAELGPQSEQPPQQCEAVLNPAWHTSPLPNGVLMMLRHPGMGWLAFVLPHEHRVHLTSLWLHQSLLYKPAEAATTAADTPVAPTPNFGAGGSGTVH